MPQPQVIQQKPQPNPYKGRITAFTLFLNLTFFLLVGLFFWQLFRFGPSGIEYVRPTDTTPWILLPVFGLSVIFLGSSVAYQYLARKTAESNPLPAIFLNGIQFLISVAIVLFIVNALTCMRPNLFGLTIC